MAKKEEAIEIKGGDASPETIAKITKDQKPKYTKEELLKIFDEIMFSGEYREEITIKGKLKITFRTRTTDETLGVSKFIDVEQYNLLTTLQEERATRNLAHSLVVFQGKDISQGTFEDRLKFIKSKPISLVSTMTDKLAEFDMKVEMACSEGEENF